MDSGFLIVVISPMFTFSSYNIFLTYIKIPAQVDILVPYVLCNVISYSLKIPPEKFLNTSVFLIPMFYQFFYPNTYHKMNVANKCIEFIITYLGSAELGIGMDVDEYSLRIKLW